MNQINEKIDWVVFSKDREYMSALQHAFIEKNRSKARDPLKHMLSELPPALLSYYRAVMEEVPIPVKLIKQMNRALVTALVSKDLPESCFERHPLFLPVLVATPYFTGHAYLPYEIVKTKLRIIYPNTERLLVGSPVEPRELETLTGL